MTPHSGGWWSIPPSSSSSKRERKIEYRQTDENIAQANDGIETKQLKRIKTYNYKSSSSQMEELHSLPQASNKISSLQP